MSPPYEGPERRATNLTEDREAGVLCECARLIADDAMEEIMSKGARVLGARGTERGHRFRSLMENAAAARFMGGHPDALLSSVFESVSESL